jgi:hypothetical protein
MRPVESRRLSTGVVPVEHGSTKPLHAVFPVVHTPYDSYKEFIR